MNPPVSGSTWPKLMALVMTLAFGAAAVTAAAAARPHGRRVAVPSAQLRVMDGDTAEIRWSEAEVETVRVLGIDTPELRSRDGGGGSRLEARGAEARGFARGAFTLARRIELLRCGRLDVYRRTLGYFFLDGRNYSVLALEAGLARETITRYGDNGLPAQAREVLKAGRAARNRPGRRSP